MKNQLRKAEAGSVRLGHLQVRAQFFVQVIFQTLAPEECSEPVDKGAEKFAHRLGRSQHSLDHRGHATPALHFLLELPATRTSQRVILGIPVIFRNALRSQWVGATPLV